MDNYDAAPSPYKVERKKILISYFEDAAHLLDKERGCSVVLEPLYERVILLLDNIEENRLEPSFEDYLTLLEDIEYSGLPGFGLALGYCKTVGNFGIYGYALMSSLNYTQFIAVADRIFNAIYEPLGITHEVSDGMLEMHYFSKSPIRHAAYIPLMEQVVTCGIALMQKQLPANTDWADCVLYCNYPEPEHADLYKAYFAGRVVFNSATMKLCVPVAWLKLELLTGDKAIKELCERKLQSILGGLNSDNKLVGQIRQRLLITNFNNLPDAKAIAKQFHISERTLRYRLAADGTSYRQIVSEVRYDLARRYLYESDLSSQEIAFALGYQHVQNFYRAFVKRSGVTPERFRKKHINTSTSQA